MKASELLNPDETQMDRIERLLITNEAPPITVRAIQHKQDTNKVNSILFHLDRIEAKLDKLLEKKKPVKARASRKHTYSDKFEDIWKDYPKVSGANKAKAYTAYLTRLRYSHQPLQLSVSIHIAVIKYAELCKETGRWAMLPATFFGPNKHYESVWDIPAKKLTVPRDDNLLAAFAVKHGLHKHGEAPQSIRNNFEYRRWIEEKL